MSRPGAGSSARCSTCLTCLAGSCSPATTRTTTSTRRTGCFRRRRWGGNSVLRCSRATRNGSSPVRAPAAGQERTVNADATAAGPVIIDADVHCPSPGIQDLLPYLDDHWQEYVRWTRFAPRSAAQVYPPWTGMAYGSASDAADAAFRDALDRDIFAAASIAVLQAYFAVESIMHPYLAPDLATAANRWLAAHWLDHDPRLRGSAMVA